MTAEDLSELDPLIAALLESSLLADGVLDTDLFRINAATLWANLALHPERFGISDRNLEEARDYLDASFQQRLGEGLDLVSCYQFLDGDQGELAMRRNKLSATHMDLLRLFCKLILNPEKAQEWMQAARTKAPKSGY